MIGRVVRQRGSIFRVHDGIGVLQARASGWGEPGAMWNPAFGARPKSTSWAGGDQDWQRKIVSMG